MTNKAPVFPEFTGIYNALTGTILILGMSVLLAVFHYQTTLLKWTKYAAMICIFISFLSYLLSLGYALFHYARDGVLAPAYLLAA